MKSHKINNKYKCPYSYCNYKSESLITIFEHLKSEHKLTITYSLLKYD